MNITVVGGSGFVGTRLTKRLLAAGHTVKIADKNDSKTYPEPIPNCGFMPTCASPKRWRRP